MTLLHPSKPILARLRLRRHGAAWRFARPVLEPLTRQKQAVQDAAILRERGTSDDLDDLVDWSVAHATVED